MQDNLKQLQTKISFECIQIDTKLQEFYKTIPGYLFENYDIKERLKFIEYTQDEIKVQKRNISAMTDDQLKTLESEISVIHRYINEINLFIEQANNNKIFNNIKQNEI